MSAFHPYANLTVNQLRISLKQMQRRGNVSAARLLEQELDRRVNRLHNITKWALESSRGLKPRQTRRKRP